MPPLRLQPLFKQRPWGGHRLAELWHKPEQGLSGWAESWEVVDLGPDQSRVLGGPFDGWLLHDLVQQHSRELLGRHASLRQFPLLFKFLDVAETLSIQVHPNDAQAAQLRPGQRGKSEAWVILDAQPHSQLWVGLKPGIDRPTFERHLVAGTVQDCLQPIEARLGDVISVPAGTVHAIGAGVCLAEIQQPSDVTFRLFDWQRVDARGRARPLHVELALQCLNFGGAAAVPVRTKVREDTGVHREVLLETEFFELRRYLSHSAPIRLPDDDRCRIVSLISGGAVVDFPAGQEHFQAGQTLVIPAACSTVEIFPESSCVLLEALPA